VRRNGFNSEEARDVVQGFFANFLEKDYLKAVKPEKGRFRSFLLVAVKHFLLNERDKLRAQKRGGGVKMLSLDFNEAEDRYGVEPASQETPETLFQRRWARELADSAMQMLEGEYRREGKREYFDAIKPHLGGGDDYATLSQKLGVSVSNLKVSIHRARKRYRELLRQVVRSTVEEDADVDDELSELLASL
jgi:DNA-directed RNA polymerase specialized sigma24 family protein